MAKPSKSKNDLTPAQSVVPGKADKRLLQALKEDISPEATPALQFLMDHAKTISSIVIAGVLIAVAIIVYQWNHKNNIAKAKSDVAAILVSKTGADKINALEALLPDVPSEIVAGVYLDMAYTAVGINDPVKAADAWDKVYNSANDPALKAVAGLGKAKALADQGKDAEALVILDTVSSTTDAAMLPQLQMEIAVLAEKSGDLQKSKAAYEALLGTVNSFDKAFIVSQIESLDQRINSSNQ